MKGERRRDKRGHYCYLIKQWQSSVVQQPLSFPLFVIPSRHCAAPLNRLIYLFVYLFPSSSLINIPSPKRVSILYSLHNSLCIPPFCLSLRSYSFTFLIQFFLPLYFCICYLHEKRVSPQRGSSACYWGLRQRNNKSGQITSHMWICETWNMAYKIKKIKKKEVQKQELDPTLYALITRPQVPSDSPWPTSPLTKVPPVCLWLLFLKLTSCGWKVFALVVQSWPMPLIFVAKISWNANGSCQHQPASCQKMSLLVSTDCVHIQAVFICRYVIKHIPWCFLPLSLIKSRSCLSQTLLHNSFSLLKYFPFG